MKIRYLYGLNAETFAKSKKTDIPTHSIALQIGNMTCSSSVQDIPDPVLMAQDLAIKHWETNVDAHVAVLDEEYGHHIPPRCRKPQSYTIERTLWEGTLGDLMLLQAGDIKPYS